MAYNSTSRQKKSELMHKKIYESAARLIDEYEYSQITVESICKLAGVAKGSFYVHFPSKEAVLVEIISRHVNEVDEDYKAIADKVSSTATSASEILLAVVKHIVYVLSNKVGSSKLKMVYRAQMSQHLDSTAVFSFNRKLMTLFQDIVTKGINSGEFRNDIDVFTLAKHILYSIRGMTFEWCVLTDGFDYEKESLLFFNTLLDGLRRRD